MFLKTNFDQLLSALQVLQPIFSMWAIMAQPRVITSFQSSCGIGLKCRLPQSLFVTKKLEKKVFDIVYNLT